MPTPPRHLDEDTLAVVPWKSPDVALIAIQPGGPLYAKNVTDKRALLAELKPRAKVLLAWPGEYSQDIFDVTEWRKRIQF